MHRSLRFFFFQNMPLVSLSSKQTTRMPLSLAEPSAKLRHMHFRTANRHRDPQCIVAGVVVAVCLNTYHHRTLITTKSSSYINVRSVRWWWPTVWDPWHSQRSNNNEGEVVLWLLNQHVTAGRRQTTRVLHCVKLSQSDDPDQTVSRDTHVCC